MHLEINNFFTHLNDTILNNNEIQTKKLENAENILTQVSIYESGIFSIEYFTLERLLFQFRTYFKCF